MAHRNRTLTTGQGFRPVGVVAGYLLKIARLAASVTQEALAESLRVDVSTVQGWEAGRRPLAATSAGDLLRLGQHLSRAGAPDSTSHHLHEAVGADLIITAGLVCDGSRVQLFDHPLASAVLRRSTANLVTWPFTRTYPQHLAEFVGFGLGRGPVGRAPQLSSGQKNRFFDHLMVVSDRARTAGEELLLRQSIYLLGFDTRASSARWLCDVHDRSARRVTNPAIGLHAHLAARSAAVALAAGGDIEKVHTFVGSIDDQRAELVNLNYWAHWMGETRQDRTADNFMLEDLGQTWNGEQLFAHLLHRLRVDAVHRPLNLRSMHTLVSYKPELLVKAPRNMLEPLNDRLSEFESCAHLSRTERDQVIGLLYALRVAHT